MDDDERMRSRFRSCAHARCSTVDSEVEHWRSKLEGSLGKPVGSGEVKAALARLTIALLPDSPSAAELAKGSGADASPAAPESDGAETEEWDDAQAFRVAQIALAYAAEHAQGIPYEEMDRREADAAHEEMDAAAQAGDLEEYRLAARRWASAWRRAAERVRRAEEEVGNEA
jgi:hypothetical protein